MKLINLILLTVFFSAKGQSVIHPVLQSTTPLQVTSLINIDEFGTRYFINNNEFTKKTDTQSLHYSNVQLGALTYADTFNPLKINLFYSGFNTVIILDNRLAERFKIDFNSLTPYRNPSHVATGYDTSIWIFNLDTQQLELFDYKTRQLRASTTPITGDVLDISSNYNSCWLLTNTYIYQFNYVGSLIKKIKNDGFTKFQEQHENLFLLKENKLYFLKKDSTNFEAINTEDLLIKQFLVTNETLYIYDQKNLRQFQIKTP